MQVVNFISTVSGEMRLEMDFWRGTDFYRGPLENPTLMADAYCKINLKHYVMNIRLNIQVTSVKQLAIPLYFASEKIKNKNKTKMTEYLVFFLWCYTLFLRASYSQKYKNFPKESAGLNET